MDMRNFAFIFMRICKKKSRAAPMVRVQSKIKPMGHLPAEPKRYRQHSTKTRFAKF